MNTRRNRFGNFAILMNRASLRLKILTVLAVCGLLLATMAYQILGIVYDQRTDQRIDARADELVTFVHSSVEDESLLWESVDRLAALEDVRSIAIASVVDRQVITSSDGTAAGAPGSDLAPAHIAAASAVDSPATIPESTGSVEFRQVTGDDSGRYLVAVELDRAVIGADLLFGRNAAVTTFLIGLVAMLAVTYLLVWLWVSKPLSRLSTISRDNSQPAVIGDQERPPVDEIAMLERAIQSIIDGAAGSTGERAGTGYSLPDALPDLWLRVDKDLQVIEARLDDDGTDGEALGVSSLADLLSTDVVDHVACTIELLEPGESDIFEFAVGIKVYQARIEAGGDSYTLGLSESPAGIQSPQVSNDDFAGMLAELLEGLPVGILETDGQGVVQYANRPSYGATDVSSMIGRPIGELLPPGSSEDGRRAIRAALRSAEAQSFEVRSEPAHAAATSMNHVVATSNEDGGSVLVVCVDVPVATSPAETTVDVRALEEQLWGLELKISEYETQIAVLEHDRDEARHGVEGNSAIVDELTASVSDPMSVVLDAAFSIPVDDRRKKERDLIDRLHTALASLAVALDQKLGTAFSETTNVVEASAGRRFHLATFVDEVAIEATDREHRSGLRVSTFVQPSLPKWLFGQEQEARLAIHQMIEFARLVAADRPLVLAAMQDASTGKMIQVRFEVQIPPPMLSGEDAEILRGCISGEAPDGQIAPMLQSVFDDVGAETFEALDIELVTVNSEATVLRCSAGFELAEDLDSGHAWLRGLRTLIIERDATTDSGLQTALGALGIIGYVVSSERELIDALAIAEELSNPYRLVIADVDTDGLESFVGQLFDGDAPVVLVGKKSEAAMVGAISAGYSGYIAKPVRQVELLEVILSTVQPPEHLTGADERSNAA